MIIAFRKLNKILYLNLQIVIYSVTYKSHATIVGPRKMRNRCASVVD